MDDVRLILSKKGGVGELERQTNLSTGSTLGFPPYNNLVPMNSVQRIGCIYLLFPGHDRKIVWGLQRMAVGHCKEPHLM